MAFKLPDAVAPIRLQVHIVNWEPPKEGDPDLKPRDKLILPFAERCQKTDIIQTLADRIVKRFDSVHKGRGVLKIHHLEDGVGSVLEMDDTVGECFPDRIDFVVRAVRYPPDEAEIPASTRFTSLAPDSSARPRKRNYGELLQCDTEYSHTVEVYGSTSKRPRLQGRSGLTPDGPILSIERNLGHPSAKASSQKADFQNDCVITNSQPSPPASHRQSYDTPQSISHFIPQDLPSSTLSNPVAITDTLPYTGKSPSAALLHPDFDREPSKAKSESAEPQNEVHILHRSNSGTPPGSHHLQHEQALDHSRKPLSDGTTHHPMEPITHVQPLEPQTSGLRTPDRPIKQLIAATTPKSRSERPFDNRKHQYTRWLERNRGKNVLVNTSSQDIWDPPDSEEGSSQSLPRLLNDSKVQTRYRPHLFSEVNGVSQQEPLDSIAHVKDPLRKWPRGEGNQAQAQISDGDHDTSVTHPPSRKDSLLDNASTQNMSKLNVSTQETGDSRRSAPDITEDLSVSTNTEFTPINGSSQETRRSSMHIKSSRMQMVGESSSYYPSSSHDIQNTKAADQSGDGSRDNDLKCTTKNATTVEQQALSEGVNVTDLTLASFTSVNAHSQRRTEDGKIKSKKRKETRESDVETQCEKQTELETPIRNRQQTNVGADEEPAQTADRGSELVLSQEAEKSASRNSKKQRRNDQIHNPRPNLLDKPDYEVSRSSESNQVVTPSDKARSEQKAPMKNDPAKGETDVKPKQVSQSIFASSPPIRESSTPSKLPACTECKKRKKRCDRETPCGACVKTSRKCQYPGQTKVVVKEQSLGNSEPVISQKTSNAELPVDKHVTTNTKKGPEKAKMVRKLTVDEKRRDSDEKVQKNAERVGTVEANVKELATELRRSESRESSNSRRRSGSRSHLRSSQSTRDPDSLKNKDRQLPHLDPQALRRKSALRSSPATSPLPSKRSVSFVEEPREDFVGKPNEVSEVPGSGSLAPNNLSLLDSMTELSDNVVTSGKDLKGSHDSARNDMKHSRQTTSNISESKKKGKDREIKTPKPVEKTITHLDGEVTSSDDDFEPPAINGVAGPSKIRKSSGSKLKQSDSLRSKLSRSNRTPSSNAYEATLVSKEEDVRRVSPAAPLLEQTRIESTPSKPVSRSPAEEAMSDTSSRSTSGLEHESSDSEDESDDSEDESEDDDEKGQGSEPNSLQESIQLASNDTKSSGEKDCKQEKRQDIGTTSSSGSVSSSRSDSEDDTTDRPIDDALVLSSTTQDAKSIQTTGGKKSRNSQSTLSNGNHSSRSFSSASTSENKVDDKGLSERQINSPKNQRDQVFRDAETLSVSSVNRAQHAKILAKSKEPNLPQIAEDVSESSENSGSSESEGESSGSDSSEGDSNDSSADEAERQLQREAQQSTEPPQSRIKVETTLEAPAFNKSIKDINKSMGNGLISATKSNIATKSDTVNDRRHLGSNKFPSMSAIQYLNKRHSGSGSFQNKDARPNARELPANKQLIDLESSESSSEGSDSDMDTDDASSIDVTHDRQTQSEPKHVDRGMKDLLRLSQQLKNSHKK